MAKIEYSYELTKIFFIPIIELVQRKNIESNSNSLYTIEKYNIFASNKLQFYLKQ